MDVYKIKGGKTLSGVIKVGGSKNALLPIVAGSIICKDIVYLENVTPLEDTYSMIDILKHLNVRVFYDNKSRMIIDSRDIVNKTIGISYTQKLRASYYFMGALLSMYKKVCIGFPGGCKFSTRPIDLHLMAFKNLGIDYALNGNKYHFIKMKKDNAIIHFNKVSVGATINAILASVKIKGNAKLQNVALEPEVDNLIEFLNKCGANITRLGRDILICGVERLNGCKHTIMEDRIEAQTYLTLGAVSGNQLKIVYSNKEHIKSFISLLKEIEVPLKDVEEGYIVSKVNEIKSKKLFFDIYPNLPTDIQPILSILFTKANGSSEFLDLIYPNRYTQVNELVSMGYAMEVIDNKLIINKNKEYIDSYVKAKDLRGVASLIVAALLSDKTTYIEDDGHIRRGYFNIEEKIRSVGGNIEKV